MKKILIVMMFILGIAAVAIAEDNFLSDFNQANALYEKGRYAQAAAAYEAIAARGQANAALFYNLGNAYYRTQQPGNAILNYEKALYLSPRDGDIRANLAFVRQMVKEPQPSFAEVALAAINRLVSLNELTVITGFFFILFIAGMILYLFRRSSWLILADVLMFAFVVLPFTGWLVLKIQDECVTRHAVVIAGPLEVRNGPGMENSVGFALPEGRSVEILGEQNGWMAIGLKQEGLKGWVESKNIGEIKVTF